MLSEIHRVICILFSDLRQNWDVLTYYSKFRNIDIHFSTQRFWFRCRWKERLTCRQVNKGHMAKPVASVLQCFAAMRQKLFASLKNSRKLLFLTGEQILKQVYKCYFSSYRFMSSLPSLHTPTSYSVLAVLMQSARNGFTVSQRLSNWPSDVPVITNLGLLFTQHTSRFN